jgi:hypothetical protein
MNSALSFYFSKTFIGQQYNFVLGYHREYFCFVCLFCHYKDNKNFPNIQTFSGLYHCRLSYKIAIGRTTGRVSAYPELTLLSITVARHPPATQRMPATSRAVSSPYPRRTPSVPTPFFCGGGTVMRRRRWGPPPGGFDAKCHFFFSLKRVAMSHCMAASSSLPRWESASPKSSCERGCSGFSDMALSKSEAAFS